MRNYKISKKDIIKSLVTEDLTAGAFFDRTGGTGRDDGKCSVCAVGAILRKTKKKEFTGWDASNATDHIFGLGEVEEAYVSGNFLSILSAEFEYASMSTNNDEAKFHALMIAEGFAPDILKFKV